MVRYQTVAKNFDWVAHPGLTQKVDKGCEILVFMKHPLSTISPVQNVIDTAIRQTSPYPWHGNPLL
jgi:hypothetical protein